MTDGGALLSADGHADLDDWHPLTSDAVESFERSGFARVAGALDESTVKEFAPIVAEVARSSSQAKLPMQQRSVYQRAFVQEVNLWQRVEAIRPLVFSTKLARLAAQLMSVDGVRIYHDQALVKEALGGRTPWHCDQYYWPIDTDRTVTAWIPLQDVPLEMGPLAFSSGSHRIDLGRQLDISDESEERIFRHPRWRELPIDEQAVRAGDLSFHQGWTFHGARANDTDRERLVFTVIYVADGARLSEPITPGQTFDRQICSRTRRWAGPSTRGSTRRVVGRRASPVDPGGAAGGGEPHRYLRNPRSGSLRWLVGHAAAGAAGPQGPGP